MSSVQYKKTSKFGIFDLAATSLVSSSHPYNEEDFDGIFATVSYDRAKDASLKARSMMTTMEKVGLTYGEVKYPAMEAVFQTIRRVLPNFFIGLNQGGKFYDLGSGSGRPVIMAALLHPFESCVGIEIIPELDELAQEASLQWKSFVSQQPLIHTQVNFIAGSITDIGCCDWTDGDVVFTNSTAFSDELFNAIAIMARALKPGSLFISLTADIRDPSHFRLVEELRLEMSWGMADVFIHLRL